MDSSFVTIELFNSIKWLLFSLSLSPLKDHSLSSLKELITALHCGIVSIISSPDSHMTSDQYTVEGEGIFCLYFVFCLFIFISLFLRVPFAVFNKIVSSCLLNVYQTLQRHLYSSVPETSQQQEPTAINK